MADLIFGRPRYAGGPVDLVFGGTGGGGGPIGGDPVDAIGTVSLGGPTVTALVLYDNRNPSRVSTIARAPHQPASPAANAPTAAWRLSDRMLGGQASAWERAAPALGALAAAWDVSGRIAGERAAPHETASLRAAQTGFVHQVAAQLASAQAAHWQTAQPAATQAGMVHQAALSLVYNALAQWQLASRWQALASAHHGSGLPVSARLCAPWQVARPWPSGKEVWPPIDPNAGLPRVIDTNLVFACPPWAGGPVHLVFGRNCIAGPIAPGATLFILPARFFMAVHTLTALRLSDGAPVPIFDVSLSADAGSFAWTFSASAPASVFEQLAPAAGLPAQIRITLDGMPFVFVVDSLQREERFGQRGVRIGGRSATALLARPYSRETSRLNTAQRTAQQLAEEALEFTGVSLDWALEDWLIPAGAYSHLGTPLAAVQAIVEAAGGYLQSHRSAAQLLARHPYPTLPGGIPGGPWNWGGAFAADVELAPDALITQSIERRDGPDINGVYVRGASQGAFAMVKRIGTAADKLAALVVDPLITATEAAQQRGLSVLGAGGPKHLVSLSLPVLTGPGQPGVLDVGQLVQINTAQPWRGRVRSVSVNAKMPTARQTVALERHLETTP